MTDMANTHDVARSAQSHERSGLVTGARWTLVILSLLFTAGALGQFFLVGLSMFEDGARWSDHKNLGHILGMLPYAMWIPAVLGKTGNKVILGTLMLFVLFMAQYGFISADRGVAKAFHPLNGTFLLLLGAWLVQQSIRLARAPIAREDRDRTSREGRS